ncbi:MAG: flagellar basal body-associated FliL family protein [Pseudomonadota bacterium]
MAEEETASENTEEKGGGMMSKIILAVVGLVLVAVGIFAGPAIKNMISPPPEASEEEEVVEASGPPIYQSLHPPLVVNFKDSAGDAHFMQVTMEAMSRDQSVINAVRENTAVIRNALILLYSGAVYEEVSTREGKEQMLEDGLAEVQRVVKETTGETGPEALYFTALVIQ